VLEFSAETQKYIVCHFKESFQLTCKNAKLVLLKGNIQCSKKPDGFLVLVAVRKEEQHHWWGGIPQQGGNWDNEGSHGKHCEKLEDIQRHGQSNQTNCEENRDK